MSQVCTEIVIAGLGRSLFVALAGIAFPTRFLYQIWLEKQNKTKPMVCMANQGFYVKLGAFSGKTTSLDTRLQLKKKKG